MKIDVKTKILYGNIIEQSTYMHDELSNNIDELTRKVLKLEDDGIIDALISLGWTPPEELRKKLED